jgi:polyphosphate kinase 2
MSVSFNKNYVKTQYTGIYESKDSFGKIGKKFIGKFQYLKKQYIKDIGYSIEDEMTSLKAHKKLILYKEEIREKVRKNRIENKKYVNIKENIFPYYNLIQDKNLVKKALKKIYEKEILQPYQVELIKLQNFLEISGKKIIILLEGRDASGKGGIIRRITRYMNPRHYRVVALGKPTDTQASQWYFQKYVEKFPCSGEMVLFDRSWYNRAMVEPIFGFCSQRQYKNFLEDVNTFERSLIKEDIILIKIYLSVSKKIQFERFNQRESNPLKNWKLSKVDLQAQKLWEQFSEKKDTMLKQTSTDTEPWIIIKSDNKSIATIETIKIILKSVKYIDKNKSMDFESNEKIVFSSKKELKNMKKN